MTLDECHDCDVEPCPLCGDQLIACDCVLVLSGLDPATLKEEHPENYYGGTTAAMQRHFEEEVAKYGGYLPWTGEWPGVAECREFGRYCKNDGRHGWMRCDVSDPGATEDMNRLYREARWDKVR